MALRVVAVCAALLIAVLTMIGLEAQKRAMCDDAAATQPE